MYLVDTSVWLDYLRGREDVHVGFLDELLTNPLAVGITDLIYMEILQGARDQNAFDRLRRYFSGQRFYRFDDPEQSHAAAARIYFDCRRQGVTVRSTVDCLIAQCAMEHGLVLLHHDSDFRFMAAAVPALRQRHFLDAG
ncbi:MAG: PIN domain-containing protein [Betaproteobacteria bacterium]|nr:PIN domain-containing protein [Betaproteobacteria bacterium]